MSPLLIVHALAGTLGILSGAIAVCVRKGQRQHRRFGAAFVLTMLTVSVLAVYLALFVPPNGAGGAPPNASLSVGMLTLYLVATAWLTVRRKEGRIGRSEYGALAVAATVSAALVGFGLRAATSAAAQLGSYGPYFVFAAFAAFAAALDVKVIRNGGISGTQRIARHIWRMCFALFFATSFFFIGQQKVMPAGMRGSPVLLALGFAPLGVMIFWLVRIRLTKQFQRQSRPMAGSAC